MSHGYVKLKMKFLLTCEKSYVKFDAGEGGAL